MMSREKMEEMDDVGEEDGRADDVGGEDGRDG